MIPLPVPSGRTPQAGEWFSHVRALTFARSKVPSFVVFQPYREHPQPAGSACAGSPNRPEGIWSSLCQPRHVTGSPKLDSHTSDFRELPSEPCVA